MTELTGLDDVMRRLWGCRKRHVQPQLNLDQVQVLIDAVRAVSDAKPARGSGRPMDPTLEQALGLCMDAVEQRFAVNLTWSGVTVLLDELRAHGVYVRSYATVTRGMP